MTDQRRLQELYDRLIAATATEKELEELYYLADQPENEIIFQEMFTGSWNELEESDVWVRAFIEKKKQDMVPQPNPAFILSWMNKRWVAAAVVLVLLAGGFLYFSNRPSENKIISGVQNPVDLKAPQSSRATITLAGGRQIFLDSAANGTLINQGNVKLLKLADGQIAYSGNSTDLTFNILTNPRGSRPVSIILSDGSRVWLNAGSSLTYPVAFAGKKREVEVTGEAYFEVTTDPARPFVVKKLNDDSKVQVLGTHFSINAYDDESSIKVTLLEGSVKVGKGTLNRLLKPGQQAQLKDGDIQVIYDVDEDEVMAWKNGLFQFEGANIKTIMREISRWYDVEVVYLGKAPDRLFEGKISRDAELSEVLRILELSNVKFSVEGRKIIVQ